MHKEPTKQSFLIYKDEQTGFWKCKYRNKNRHTIFEFDFPKSYESEAECKKFLDDLQYAEIMYQRITESFRPG